MRTLLFAAAAALLASLVSCESTGNAAAPVSRPARSFVSVPASAGPFAGGAPPSAAFSPPERYYAFGGGYSGARRQTEGDDYNFLQNSTRCYKRCGYYNHCGYGYGWRGSYRSRCW